MAFGGYFAARVFVDTWLRQHYKAPLSATWPFTQPGPDLSHDWVLSQTRRTAWGRISPSSLSPQGVCLKGVGNCIGNHGSGFTHAVYEPASRFWLFQGIETALFAGVALVLIAFAGLAELRARCPSCFVHRKFTIESSFQAAMAASAMRVSSACSNARQAWASGERLAISSGRWGSSSARAGLTIRT